MRNSRKLSDIEDKPVKTLLFGHLPMTSLFCTALDVKDNRRTRLRAPQVPARWVPAWAADR